MSRLFISLYLAVILGIAFINFIAEKVWQHYASTQPQEITSLQDIAQQIPTFVERYDVPLADLEKLIGVPVVKLAASDLQGLIDEPHSITQEASFILYDDNQLPIFYVPYAHENAVFLVGPIPETDPNPNLKYSIKGIAYVLLAIVLSLWTWPLWKDLKLLENMSTQITQGNLDYSIKTLGVSPIAPMIKKFDEMSIKLQALLDEQKHVINSISHELRTPMTRLRFALASLDNSCRDEASDMKTDLDEMESLIEELLSLSRLENIMQQMEKEDVNLSQLLNNQMEKLQRGTPLALSLQTPENLIVKCNGGLIERATQNIITNAIKYAKSTVKVSVSVAARQVVIAVEDDGVGIKPEDRESVFKMFKTLDFGDNGTKKGYGLGLAIVDKIVSMHEGNCRISQSKLGGALVCISFPCVD